MLQRTLPAGFIAPCVPTKTDKLPSGSDWLHEIKQDGFRVIARKKGAQVRLLAAVTQASVGRAAVQGMGGVGKTALAIEYAHRFRGLYAGVCWCPAETRTGLLSALASLAVPLGAAEAEMGVTRTHFTYASRRPQVRFL